MQKLIAFLQHVKLELITTSKLLSECGDPLEMYPLVPVGIPAVEHKCEGGWNEEEDSFAAVSKLSSSPAGNCFTRLGDASAERQACRKIIKAFRLDARDPAVSHSVFHTVNFKHLRCVPI